MQASSRAALCNLVEENLTTLIREAAVVQRHSRRARFRAKAEPADVAAGSGGAAAATGSEGGAGPKRRRLLHADDVNMALSCRGSSKLYLTNAGQLNPPTRWEPQSAQSPEFNNNDLTVFPAMSKRHSVVLKKSSGRKVADKDTIFEKALEVFKEYPSSAIARGHILAYRLIKKALEIDGRNDYLGNGLHCNVRQDFIDCDKGVRLRLKKDD